MRYLVFVALLFAGCRESTFSSGGSQKKSTGQSSPKAHKDAATDTEKSLTPESAENAESSQPATEKSGGGSKAAPQGDSGDEPAPPQIGSCLAQWGQNPFGAGGKGYRTVKVAADGTTSSTLTDRETSEPALVLIQIENGAIGEVSLHLGNPNGWYCIDAGVDLLSSTRIEVHCKAKIVRAQVEDSGLGDFQFTRFGENC